MSDIPIPTQLQGWAERATDDIMAQANRQSANETAKCITTTLESAVVLGIIAEREERGPIPMRLRCPQCHALHIDEGEYATKLHKTHTCQECGEHFQPALVPTVGVKFLPGCKSA